MQGPRWERRPGSVRARSPWVAVSILRDGMSLRVSPPDSPSGESDMVSFLQLTESQAPVVGRRGGTTLPGQHLLSVLSAGLCGYKAGSGFQPI